MKKISVAVLFAAFLLPLLFTACQKEEQEGIYTPKKKIKRIYTEEHQLAEVYDQSTNTWQTEFEYNQSKQPTEIWEWDGDLLKTITCYYDYESWAKTHFFYDEKRLSKIVVSTNVNNPNVDENSPDCWMYFLYNYQDGKLSSIQGHEAEGNLFMDISVSHNGTHISKMVLEGFWEELPAKSSIGNLISFVHSHVILPSTGIALHDFQTDCYKSKDGSWIEEFDFEWDSDNIKTIIRKVSELSDDNGVISITNYSYDNKINPYYGSFLSYEPGWEDNYYGYLMPTSKNNVVTATEDDWSWTENTYTYDGDLPLTQTKREVITYGEFEKRHTYTTTIYFEYE